MVRPRKDIHVADELAARIASGIYMPGERLPSVRELGPEFHVSHCTMQKALASLQERGVVAARQGSGWYVTSRADFELDRAADTFLVMSPNFAHMNQTYATVLIYQLIEQYLANHGRRFTHIGPNMPPDQMGLIARIRESPAPYVLIYEGVLDALRIGHDFWALLGEQHRRIVFFTFATPSRVIPHDCVTIDWLTGTEAAVDELVRCGVRRPLFVGYDGVSWSDERRGGFLRALRHHGLWEFGSPQPSLVLPTIVSGRPNEDDTERAALALLDYLPDHRVDGILFAHDRIMEAAVRLAPGRHWPVMVGFDNSVWAAEHGYTSVSINARLFVDECFRLLSLPPLSQPRIQPVPTMLIGR